MTTSKKIKKEILQNPQLILNDHEIMNVLLNLKETKNKNIIDIRDIFIRKLENELQELQKKYSNFLKTIVENTKSIEAINESILILMKQKNINEILSELDTNVKKLLFVDEIKILIVKNRNKYDDYKNLKFYMNEDTILSLFNIPKNIKIKPIQRMTLKNTGNFEEVSGSEIIISLRSSKKKTYGFLILTSTDKMQFNENKDSNFLLFFSKILSTLIEKHLE